MAALTAVIPAAGRGTRLFPLTYSIPKEMLPLGPKPAIQLVVEELVAAGLQDFVIVIGNDKGAIVEHFAALREAEEAWATLNLRYATQAEPRGLGDAVLCAAADVAGDLLVALGDAVIWGSRFGDLARRMLQVYRETGAAAVIAAQEVSLADTARYGIIKPGEAGPGGSVRALDLVEKPGPQAAPSRLAVCARYVLTHGVFEALSRVTPGHGGEVQLTDALRLLAQEQTAFAVPLQPDEERWDVGSLKGYGRASQKAWQALGEPE
jgi:UTP--glucose-1-phosphate uridylyltransferase